MIKATEKSNTDVDVDYDILRITKQTETTQSTNEDWDVTHW
jgi:hypothetical protein